jgi:carbamoyltransferase
VTARYVLGVSTIVAAISEERLDRRKKSQGFYHQSAGSLSLPPLMAITHLLRQEGITLADLELIVCGRSITTCRADLLRFLPVDPGIVVEPDEPGHHLAHAWSAYATAPFAECDVLVVDEQGHWASDATFERGTWYAGSGDRLTPVRALRGTPTSLSLGMYFDVFAALTGLSEAGLPAAGKLMALAAYGERRPEWEAVIELAADGDATVDLGRLDAFLQYTAKVPTSIGFEDWTPRSVEDLRVKFAAAHWSSQLAADLARKAQDELESALLHVTTTHRNSSGARYLALAGGVALNCTANARLRESGYEDVFVHPAATDDGCAVGLAAYGWHEILGRTRTPVSHFSPRLGGRYGAADRAAAFAAHGLTDFSRRTTVDSVADLVVDGRFVCWFEGRSEWGPRALGSRSILADPTRLGVTRKLNAEVKFREPFRPFGISMSAEDAARLLDLEGVPASLGPYMLSVAQIRDERLRPLCHRDGTIRYQTVGSESAAYYELLVAIGDRTGMQAVINTSFNTYGEPLVENPADAVRQFLLCGADALYLDGDLIVAAELPAEVLAQARRQAVRDAGIDLLDLALKQEAAGYLDAAAVSLREAGEAPLAPARRRAHAALSMRLAEHIGDRATSVMSAEEVLRWAGLPRDAADAALLLASAGERPRERRDAARFLAAIGVRGRALPIIESVLGGEADHAP